MGVGPSVHHPLTFDALHGLGLPPIWVKKQPRDIDVHGHETRFVPVAESDSELKIGAEIFSSGKNLGIKTFFFLKGI